MDHIKIIKLTFMSLWRYLFLKSPFIIIPLSLANGAALPV
jgi:hypothetical protein